MNEHINVIILEDNLEYIITDEIESNNNKYVYLVNENNIKNFCIRKIKNDKLIGLDNEEEFKQALILFKEKNGQ